MPDTKSISSRTVENTESPTTLPNSKSFTERGRIVFSWVVCVAFYVLSAVTKSYWPLAGYMSGTLFMVGVAMALIACMGRVWCSLYIDGFKTKQLVTCGPYSVCRNPLYFFSAIGATGVAFGTATFMAPAIVITCFACCYPVIIRAEERRLAELHGKAFIEYCSQVPAFFPRWRSLITPRMYQIHTRIVGRRMIEATWFVWLTILANLLYQLHQRTEILPTLFTSH